MACGVNKYLFEMANIRDRDSWVHQQEPVRATEKAKDLVRMAVARAAPASSRWRNGRWQSGSALW